MKSAIIFLSFLTIIFVVFSSCEEPKPSGLDGWLKGDCSAKFETIANHLRGFDMAMIEVDYRYIELYWAGQDKNWKLADYQLNKMKLSIDNALIRRPKREENMRVFLNNSMPLMDEAIKAKDTALFNKNFELFMGGCNACHVNEKLAFFNTGMPEQRLSTLRKLPQ